MIEKSLTPLTILWIDDDPIEAIKELFDDNGFKVIIKEYYEDGIAWLRNPEMRKICDAVILDVNSKTNASQKKPSMDSFTDNSHIVYNLCETPDKVIPWFVLTMGTGYDGATSLDHAIPNKSWSKQKYYIKTNKAHQQSLVETIKTQESPNLTIRNRYSGIWDSCDDKAEVAMFKIINGIEGNNISDTSLFIDMRIALSATVSRGKECGILPDFVTKQNEAKYILRILASSDEAIVPTYISYNYAALCDTVNNGCHPGDEDPKHLKVHPDVMEGRAPYLVQATFNQLITILKWFSSHYTAEKKVQEMKLKVKEILEIPSVGDKVKFKKDKTNNYYYKKCITKSRDVVTKSEDELEYLSYRVESITFNTNQANSNLYPYFINVVRYR